MTLKPASPQSTLLSYLQDDLFANWKSDREKHREPIWNKAHDAFVGNQDSTYWQTWKIEEGEDWRSKFFSMLIKTKVIAAYSAVIDILLQGGEFPLAFKDAVDQGAKPNPQPQTPLAPGAPPSPPPGIAPRPAPGINPSGPGPVPGQPPQAMPGGSNAEQMEKRVKQQLLDCKADRHLMRAVLSMAMYGEGSLKTPIVKLKKKTGYQLAGRAANGRDLFGKTQQEINLPAVEYMSVWDIFSDPEDDDIQENIGFFHRVMLTPYDLRQKLGTPYFDDDAIKQVIKEYQGEQSRISVDNPQSLTPALRDITNRFRVIPYLEFWGRVPAKLVTEYLEEQSAELNGLDQVDFAELGGEEVEVNVCIAGDTIVRLAPNYLGLRPRVRAYWEPVLDDTTGRGVAENLFHDQQMLNGVLRAIIDNAALAGNVMLALKDEYIQSKGKGFKPGKAIYMSEEIKSVQEAIQQIIIQDVSGGLLNLFGILQQAADEDSNLPKLISGETVQTKNATAFEVDQRMQSAGKYLGSVIKNIDEGILEPLAEGFYHYNMIEPGGEAQGDYSINATGFSSFQSRYVRNQKLLQLLTMALQSPVVQQEVKIRPHLETLYKLADEDPDEFLLNDQEKQQRAQAAQQQQQQQMALAKQQLDIEVKEKMAEIEKVMAEVKLTLAKVKTEEATAREKALPPGLPPAVQQAVINRRAGNKVLPQRPNRPAPPVQAPPAAKAPVRIPRLEEVP